MPMPFKEITKITLEAAKPIELDFGVVLPPGSYQGARLRTRDDLPGDVIWKHTRYRIELTAEQIASMGAKDQTNQTFEEIDVTKFVRRGQLILRLPVPIDRRQVPGP